MKLLLIVFLAPFLVGCESLKRITDGASETHPNQVSTPVDYKVTGVTAIDYQVIQPVRCVGSDVTVRVKRPGEEWHDCNKYEVKIDTVGTGGGGVWMRRICYPTFDQQGKLISLVLTGKPVAPAGTEYEIRSVLRP